MKALNLAARIVTALALLINAYIHFRLAATFDALTGPLLSLGDLFRIQGAAGVLVALLVVVLSRRWAALVAGGLAGAGIVMLVVSVYAPLDLSAIGLPVISESAWYPDKLVALASQGVAMIAALLAALSTATGPAASGQN
ncbi:MAG TPA: hypothetical protein VFT01_01650 [Homoserinimonas sp.]|nr:hypothetical protein [Homoserinimonas sp.]